MQYHCTPGYRFIFIFIYFLLEQMSLITSKLTPSKDEKRELWFMMGIMIL